LNTCRNPSARLLLLACAALFPAFAVDPTRVSSQYVRDRWGPDQGFPRGSVYAITQGVDGYLWIGTEAGLIRFDGSTFRLMQDASGPSRSVLGLMGDRDGSLWLRLFGPTLLRYRGGVFEDAMAALGMPYSNLTTMSRANDDVMLLGRLEPGVVVHRDGKFELLAGATPLARSPVLALAQTINGDIWMGTRDAGLFRFSAGRVSAVSEGLPDTKINCLLSEPNGNLWVGTDAGLARWNGSALVSVAPSAKRFQALTIARDRDSNIWVGTDREGLLRIPANAPSNASRVEGFTDAVTAIFEDREGNLWIGSANGIERIRDSAFVTYSVTEGFPTDGSNPVFVDRKMRTWFPPEGGGLWWFQGQNHGRIAAGDLDRDVVYSITGGDDELWLGRQRGGLTRLREANGAFTATTYTAANGLAQNSVYSVYRTRAGAVWAGTLSGGVSRLLNGKFTTYTSVNGLASNTVASILETADGAMWFATPTGLSSLQEDRWKTFGLEDGLPSLNVNCLLQDAGGVLWAGTASGLAFRASGRFQRPDGAPAALREQIFGIAEDKHGWLWLATSNHVLRVRRDRLMQGRLVDGDVREYGHADGLRGVEGVKRHQSVIADAAGRIWFSLNRGISVVDPVRLTRSSVPAIAHIQSISADGVPIDHRAGVARIPAGSRRITLGYVGLSLAAPERVRFRYRLDGFDGDWSKTSNSHEAIYTNLTPQAYRFRVVASDPDGVWNTQETTIALEVAPLFWQTAWFRYSTILAVTLLIAAIFRFRVHQLTSRLNIRFEERLAERTRIAQDLHDTLLQGFLSASMQLHVVADRLPDDSPAKSPMNRVLQLMGRVIEEGRHTVSGLRSDNKLEDLAAAFSLVRQELASDEGIDFRVIVDGQPRPLHPLLRDEIYRIGREALVNAFRHSRAERIEMELEYTSQRFRCLVRDNGCGIDPAVIKGGREGHWGLPGMRERAERIGGQLHVWSSAAAGTEVELTVPAYVAFKSRPGAADGWLGRLFNRMLRRK